MMRRWILLPLFMSNMFGSDFNIELTNETLMLNTTIKHYLVDWERFEVIWDNLFLR